MTDCTDTHRRADCTPYAACRYHRHGPSTDPYDVERRTPSRESVLTGAGLRARCRCTNDDAGRCPNAVDDPDEAPYCTDCHTLRVYDMDPEDCTHDAHDL